MTPHALAAPRACGSDASVSGAALVQELLGAILEMPSRAPFLEFSLGLARRNWRQHIEDAGQNDGSLLLLLAPGAEPLAARLQRQLAPYRSVTLARWPSALGEMGDLVGQHPATQVLLCGQGTIPAGWIWKLIWDSEILQYAADPGTTPSKADCVDRQIHRLQDISASPRPLPDAALHGDPVIAQQFHKLGGWLALGPADPDLDQRTRLAPRPETLVIFSQPDAAGRLPLLPALPPGTRAVAFSTTPLDPPAPWEPRLISAQELSHLWQAPERYLPGHELSLGLRADGVLLPAGDLVLTLSQALRGRYMGWLPDDRSGPASDRAPRLILRRNTPEMRLLSQIWAREAAGYPTPEQMSDMERIATARDLPVYRLSAELLARQRDREAPAPTAPNVFAGRRVLEGLRGPARAAGPHHAPQIAEITVLTPTGDRLAAFARCAHLLRSQTLRPREWLIVDDGQVPVDQVIPLPDWARVIRRPRRPDDPPHTLSANLAAALPEITTEKVIIFEDDDWYAPEYLATLSEALEDADLTGLNHIHYYHLRAGLWKTGTPPAHTALAQTAFRRATAGAILARLCADPPEEVRQFGVVDRHWWHGFTGRKRLIQDHPHLHLGLKGGFGRPGIASGHDAAEVDYLPDPEGAKFHEILGGDAVFYDRLRRAPGSADSLVIYTALPPDLASDLARPQPALISIPGVDLVLLSADPPDGDCAPWRWLASGERSFNRARELEMIRALPHLWFPDREWSLWIDPALILMQDPRPLLAAFCADQARLIGAASLGGRSDTRLLLRRHNHPEVMRAMLGWWQKGPESLGQTLGALEVHPLRPESPTGLAGDPLVHLPAPWNASV